MKTRDGFISNSSTTSFTVLITPEKHQEAIDKLKEQWQKQVMKVLTESPYYESVDICGTEMLKTGYMGDGHWGLPDISKVPGLDPSKTERQAATTLHAPRCRFEGKCTTEFCPSCGHIQWWDTPIEQPRVAWMDYQSIVEEMAKESDEIMVIRMTD